jgi:hypothetical protein
MQSRPRSGGSAGHLQQTFELRFPIEVKQQRKLFYFNDEHQRRPIDAVGHALLFKR